MTRIDTEKSVKICFICGSDNSLFSNDKKITWDDFNPFI